MIRALCNRKIAKALLVVVAVSSSASCATERTDTAPTPAYSPSAQPPCSRDDLMEALRALVAEPRLASYFHLGQLGRSSIEVVDDDDRLGLGGSIALTERAVASSPKVVQQASRLRLFVNAVSCQSDSLSLHWRLPAEGLYGQAEFTRETLSRWVLTDLTLVER